MVEELDEEDDEEGDQPQGMKARLHDHRDIHRDHEHRGKSVFIDHIDHELGRDDLLRRQGQHEQTVDVPAEIIDAGDGEDREQEDDERGAHHRDVHQVAGLSDLSQKVKAEVKAQEQQSQQRQHADEHDEVKEGLFPCLGRGIHGVEHAAFQLDADEGEQLMHERSPRGRALPGSGRHGLRAARPACRNRRSCHG